MKRPPIASLERYDRPWVSVPVLAKYLDCHPRTVLRMIDMGTLHAVKVGRCWRVAIEEARRAFPRPAA